ncbi:GlcNAc-PI de-N-acetylase [Advenella incenata]|uniref:GlcNAc-PI de-N-acetylase n=1 Tax=Advenella incenata TaxID=267800 RepID=A0A4Q7V968_9BURK|nr:PIG-L family deacetylase [Advenella incenata]RZT92070.1 GlcNAc-PI de-N-acetylase [Advenella incenata]
MNVPRSHLFQGRLLKKCLTTALLVAIALAQAAHAAPERGATLSPSADIVPSPLHTSPGAFESTPIAPTSDTREHVLAPVLADQPASGTGQVLRNAPMGRGLAAGRSVTGTASAGAPVFSLLAANAITAEPVMPSGSGMPAAPGSSFKSSASPALVPPITSHIGVAPADRNKAQTQCHGRRDQVFVAHEDDDLLFMNPDIFDTIRAGGCIQVVYLTAGERGEGVGYMSQRENGVRAAYALMAGAANTWVQSPLLLNKVHIAQYSLWKNPRISLVFLRIKDPWLDKGWGDLTPLSRLEIQPEQMAQALGEYFETYTRASLVKTLSALILRFEPGKIRLMDDSVETPYNKLCWRCTGHDHPDHIASARLVRDAMAVTAGNYEAVSYVNYPNQERPLTLTLRQLSEKSRIFNVYAQYDYRYCNVPLNCREPIGPAALWAERMYYSSQSNTAVVSLYTEAAGLGLFTRGEYSNAAVYWNGRKKTWTVLGGLAFTGVKPFLTPSGHLAVFARDGQGQLYFRRASVATPENDASWSAWYRLPVLLTTQPQVVTVGKQVRVVGMGADGYYYYLRSTDMRSWQKSRLPVLKTASQTFALLQHGTQLWMLAQTLKGELWISVHHEKSGWGPWSVAAGPDSQGGLTALVTDKKILLAYYRNRADGHLYLAQGRLGDDARSALRWTSVTDQGPEFQDAPAVLKTRSGSMVIATMSRTGKSIWTRIDDAPTRIKGPFASAPTLVDTADGVMLYARKASDNRWIQQYSALHLVDKQWQDSEPVIAPPFYGGHTFDGSTDIPEQEQAQLQMQQRQPPQQRPQQPSQQPSQQQ